MESKLWTLSEVLLLKKMYNEGALINDISKVLKRTLSACNYKIQDLISKKALTTREKHNQGHAVDLSKFKLIEEMPDMTDYLRIKGDVMCVSDVHIPYWSKELFTKMFAIARKFNIKQLIFHGDFLNLDSFSTYISGFTGQDNMEIELNKATAILIECLKVFDKIYITQGNHEDRLYKTLKGNMPASRFFKIIQTAEMEKRIITSDYNYCQVNDRWLVVHPRDFSQRGGQTPADIANTENMSVISSHNHHFGIQCSLNGNHIGIDHGMGGDPNKIPYYKRNISKNRKWQMGFSAIINNYGYAWNLKFTDWRFWLK